MKIAEKISKLGIVLPEPPTPVAAYVPAVQTGDLIFISGQLPFVDGALAFKGTVGGDVTLEQAQEAAKVSAINCLAVINSQVDLDKIVRVVKLTGYVASSPDFYEQPQVINGASNLLVEIFGDAGKHSRAAVGVAALPMGAPVEVEMIVQVGQ